MGKTHGKPKKEVEEGFTGEAAAQDLKNAMKGAGTDEAALTKVLTSHSNAERQVIKSAYKTMFGEDLEADLKSELRGDLEDMVLALMTPARVYDARELRKAMKGGGTDEKAVIEIMCTRTNCEIADIKELYEKEFEESLEDALKGEAHGHFERLLVSQCNAGRDECSHVDDDLAQQDAQNIYDAGEGQFGTDESAFNAVLCSRSYPQLRATFKVYQEIAGKDIEDAIKSECTGSLEDGFLAIVKTAKNPAVFFAERLYNSIHGAGTDDDTLIRILASRSEVDLDEIEEAYSMLYEKTLEEAVEGDCSGKYRALLIAVLSTN